MSKNLSLLLYMSTYTVSACLLTTSKKRKGERLDICFWISILLPSLFAYMRYNVGTDYMVYLNMYKRISNMSVIDWVNNELRFDGIPLFLFAIGKIGALFSSSKLFFGLAGVLTVFPLAIYIKRSYWHQNVFLVYFAFLVTIFSMSLNIIKQGLAISTVIYGLKYIYSRQPCKFLLICLLATMFHPTAIVAIPMYVLWVPSRTYVSFKRILIYILCILGVVLLPAITALLPGRFQAYQTYGREISNKSFWFELLVFTIVALFSKRLVWLDERNSVLLSVYFVGIIVGITGFGSPFLKRLSMYYTNVQHLLIVQIPFFFQKNETYFLNIMIWIYYIVYFILFYFILGHSNIIPYNFFK